MIDKAIEKIEKIMADKLARPIDKQIQIRAVIEQLIKQERKRILKAIANSELRTGLAYSYLIRILTDIVEDRKGWKDQ